MRILYGVTGEGLGHTMRARVLACHLVARGHDVLVAASGRAVAILARHLDAVVAIDGLRIRYRDGTVQRRETVRELLRGGPSALARNVEVALSRVLAFGPELVVTDFDSFAYTVGRLLRIPVVSVDHQHVVSRFHHPRAVLRRASLDFAATRAFVGAKLPRCDRYVVSSFFFPEPRATCSRTTTLVGPVLRDEVAATVPAARDGDHVLVYQTAAGDRRLLPALAAVRGVRFVVYGLGRAGARGPVELRTFDEQRFAEDLAGARAVIANGGFTTLSEAIRLGKPVLSVPVRHQGEQELNAAYVEHLGLGVCTHRLDPSTVARFLDRLDELRAPADPRVARGTEDARLALDRALAEAA